ncbi:acyl-CoA synthetase [Psychromarinibacter sp. C21-152]|uniref:Acyl-CoA synthetase n=1 Tax=Psychromarinibacter sediminicola TaxID=3033385 RepID=A0AAE3NM02_9RHOB|nr:acyl-CoA synthetase [Psychromarinibacter sediminicola]MDF0600318.1 acyl-CoA synthetase [Psychromarinibacter sediminicola]
MATYASAADRDAIQNEMNWEERDVPATLYQLLDRTARRFPTGDAFTFQFFSDPKADAETLTWQEMQAAITRAANLFRSLGVGAEDSVALLMPNCTEAFVALYGAQVAGIAAPINPLLDAEQIAGILRETDAKVLVTLRAFPKTDVAQKAAEALRLAPNVETVLEVDLLRYLSFPKSWIVPLIRPKVHPRHTARILRYGDEIARQSDTLDFEDSPGDRVSAYFHTGGTTGMPKVAQHLYSGFVYNGWIAERLLFTDDDTLICPLPLFHVFAAVVVGGAVMSSGAHVVCPTPQGYRGEGVFDNFWKLIERWKVTFVITVPTAISALMQRKVDADLSSLKIAFSGSAPLPVELFHRFSKATDVTIVEGYGLTEATCLVAVNPPDGEKRIGSVGLPFPHTDVRILDCDDDGTIVSEKGVDEVGEICVDNPGVYVGHTYMDPAKNRGLYADGKWLRTGDLGRLDPDGYLWITGRAKDLIIRGGHNIDPAEIEDALHGHEAVAFAGAIGQPDSFAGELPCAYVELVEGAEVTEQELLDWASKRIHERAARPKYLEILPELPKTAVGKVYKPDLRKRAIKRVYNAALAEKGLAAEVVEVVEDRRRGLVAKLRATGEVDEEAVVHCLGEYARPWDWAKAS